MRYLVIRCRSRDPEEFIAKFLENYLILAEAPARYEYPVVAAIIHSIVVMGVERKATRYARAAVASAKGCYTIRCVGTLRRAKRLAYTLINPRERN